MSSQAEESLDACFTRLYANIRQLAGRLGWTSTNPTLNATALAHEAYLKLRKDPPDFANKSYEEIISIFATAMRQILIDAARRKNAQKRTLALIPRTADLPIEDVLTIARAIEQLTSESAQQGRVAEARFLLGMTAMETGLALGLSQRTVERQWEQAKARLNEKILSKRE